MCVLVLLSYDMYFIFAQVRLCSAPPEHLSAGVGRWHVDGGRGGERGVGKAMDDTRAPREIAAAGIV